jgi:hypothetical protein
MKEAQTARQSKTVCTFIDFRRQLQDMLPTAAANIELAVRLEDVIPIKDRRRIWQMLQDTGLNLPHLGLSKRVLVIVVGLVVGPVVLLALALHTASIVLSVLELSVLAYRVTRPLAVYPPPSWETVHEAVLHLTRFRIADYRAGFWPHEDIAAKVRLIIASTKGVRLQDIHDDSSFDICD